MCKRYSLCPSNFLIIVSMKIFGGATWPLRTGIVAGWPCVDFYAQLTTRIPHTICSPHIFHFPNPASLIEHLQQPISDNTITTIYRQNNVLNCIACNRLYKISIYSHRFSIIKHQENKSSLVNKIIRPWQIFHCANYSVVLDRLNSTHSA